MPPSSSPSSHSPKPTVIIAGAGPAGLTAAYELLARGDVHPIVCEATEVIGGISQTYNYRGNRIDIGGHRFFSKSERVMRWWLNILPLQGAPAADTEEKKHEIEYATEAVIRFLCPECATHVNLPPTTYNLQPVSLPAPNPEIDDRVMLQRPRLSRIFYRRKFFPYPISITLTVAFRLGIINTFLITLSYLWAQMFPREDETYLDAFFTNRFGARLYTTFFKDYTEKVWGVSCDKLRADWGSQRIKGLSLKRAVFHAVKDLLSSNFSKIQQERETSLITRFYYPKFGPGQMWETVADDIRKCGGEVRLNTRVSGLHCERKRVTKVMLENTTDGSTTEVPCYAFFSSMPLKHVIGMITPHPPASVVEVAEGLKYRDFLTVGLLCRTLCVGQGRGKPATHVPDNWIYVQENDVRVGRIQIFNNWSPYLVADRKNTLWIGLEYFVDEGGDLWIKPDKEMIDLGVSEMEKIGFLRKEDVLDACVLRVPKAYPAYLGSYDQLHVVRDYLNNIENLYPIGRNGQHRYNNQDHSMLTAMLSVDHLLSGRREKGDLWMVNADEEYHEGGIAKE